VKVGVTVPCAELCRSQLDEAAIDDIRLALNQNQPLGNERFLARIEKMTGMRREARPRGRPRLEEIDVSSPLPGQGKLSLE
jgi:putative transposase